MARHGVSLEKKKVATMWRLFSQGLSEQAISRKCAVCRNTVHKYRISEGWDDRRNTIIRRAKQKADEQQTSKMAENMYITSVLKQKLFDQIRSKTKEALSNTPYSDIDRIIRLEEFLQGRPDSRPQIDYADYTEEQLTVELQGTVEEILKVPGVLERLLEIPQCRQELQKLLNSATS